MEAAFSALCLPHRVLLSLKCLSQCAAQRVLLCVLLIPASACRYEQVCVGGGVSGKGSVGQRSMSMSFADNVPPFERVSHQKAMIRLDRLACQ